MNQDLTTPVGTRRGLSPMDLIASMGNRIRIAAKDRAQANDRVRAAELGPTVQERQSQLIDFYEQYENLVEVMCDAAQYGPTPALARRYADHRARLVGNYEPVRRFLGAFVRYSPEIEDTSDPFEALTEYEDIGTFLLHDDGLMIDRITRTREALSLYAEHLRQLAARTA